LPLAPSPRIGFEMTLLRMLAFCPAAIKAAENNISVPAQRPNINTASASTPAAAISAPIKSPPAQSQPSPTTISAIAPAAAVNIDGVIKNLPANTDEWVQLIPKLNLSGFTQALAINCAVNNQSNDLLELALDPSQTTLRNPKQETRLAETLSAYFGRTIKLQITVGGNQLSTPARNKQQQQAEQLQAAKEAIHNDANVQTLIKTFGAKIAPDSIQSKNPVMLIDETDPV
jgi:DNA polymerase-3 subunit gamma/tau